MARPPPPLAPIAGMKGLSDWFQNVGADDAPFSTEDAVERLGLALAGGFVVAGVYVLGTGRRREETATLPTTLVLLTVVIAIVTLVIGNNMARAFGLVGALSIVRFRTVVEDTRDTAFVIFAVVVGMAIGAGFPKLAILGIPAVLIAAVLMRWVNSRPVPPRPSDGATLTVRVGLGTDPEALLGADLRAATGGRPADQHLDGQAGGGPGGDVQGPAAVPGQGVRPRVRTEQDRGRPGGRVEAGRTLKCNAAAGPGVRALDCQGCQVKCNG